MSILTSYPRSEDGRYLIPCVCGNARPLSASAARRALQNQSVCLACHNKAIAASGGNATLAKYGREFLVKIQQDYQLANESPLERPVREWLEAHKIRHIRQYRIKYEGRYWLLDFVLYTGERAALALEVNGGCHDLLGEDYHRAKYGAILNSGYRLATLSQSDVQSGDYKEILYSLLPARQMMML